ncbi:MAG: hypothetical protein KC584_17550, partial [Nitrospira sp.]|nr:hypothetical protein [Nitrospira sp.]
MSKEKPKSDGVTPLSLSTYSEAEASQVSATAKLQAARSQLIAYAKDLKQMLEQEGQKTQLLKKAHAQMLAYARDLKVSLEAEQ